MKRILVANIFGIGDVLFTTPLIANLKKGFANVSVDYLCNDRTKHVVEMDPDVDDIFVYEKDFFVELWHRSRLRCLKKLYGLFSEIRKKHYDAVFDFTLSRKFGLFFTLAGVPRRIGLDYRKRGLFLTDRVPLEGFEGGHVVEHYLDLLERVELPVSERQMRITPGERDLEEIGAYLGEMGVEGRPLAAIVPGGGASWGHRASRKRWSAEGFSEAADMMSDNGVSVAILGDASEADLCRDVALKMKKKPVLVENDLPLKDYIALLSNCDLVLCNDGGPLHIAVALGVKTVSIFGPVDSGVYGPYPFSGRHRVIEARQVPCRPCYNRFKLPECGHGNQCLTGITPEEVAKTCLELLKK